MVIQITPKLYSIVSYTLQSYPENSPLIEPAHILLSSGQISDSAANIAQSLFHVNISLTEPETNVAPVKLSSLYLPAGYHVQHIRRSFTILSHLNEIYVNVAHFEPTLGGLGVGYLPCEIRVFYANASTSTCNISSLGTCDIDLVWGLVFLRVKIGT